jgi:Fe-S cluster assembly protein SufD
VLDDASQCVQTRLARPGKDATVDWAAADIGAALTVNELAVAVEEPGITAGVTAIFFPRGKQHVDVLSRIDHNVGNSVSNTVVKSAATDDGQARYVGNIRIAEQAQGSNAALRDDALLLSKRAHIDSVPALEIAANDVKAYHGATVGALDRDQIFYMQSRGISASDAERMIAIAFFEPAIERFPTQSLRDALRASVESKLG